MKAQGKCTTDHISAAGQWLKYRGHLENISGNLFLGVVSAFDGRTGEGKGHRRARRSRSPTSPSSTARPAAAGARSAIATTARARPASTPRWSPGSAAASSIFARSFARIHETNLKKQGMVPLTFADPATYDQIDEDDRINVLGLPPVPGQNVHCQIVKPDGTTIDFEGGHTFSPEQVEWFKAGAALNIVRQKVADGEG